MKFKNVIHFALAETRKERSKLLFSVLSIAIGVGSLIAVEIFNVSFENSIARDAQRLMGADIQLKATRPIETKKTKFILNDLKQSSVGSSLMIQFNSMIFNKKASRMVKVISIEDSYPFYGNFKVQPENALTLLHHTDSKGIIVDKDLIEVAGLSINSKIKLGEASFQIVGTYHKDSASPDLGFSLGLPVLISRKHLKSTKLIGKGSRIRYIYNFKTPKEFDSKSFKEKNWESATEENLTILTYREAASGSRRFMENLSKFFSISALITLLLGSLGIGTTFLLFLKNKFDHIAILRSLGATQAQIFFIYCSLGLCLALIGSLIGVGIGIVIPKVFLSLAMNYLPVQLKLEVSIMTILYAVSFGLVISFLFFTYPIYRLQNIPPLRVLRKDIESKTIPLFSKQNIKYLLAALALFSLVTLFGGLQFRSFAMSLYFLLAVIAAVMIMLTLITVGLRVLKKNIKRVQNVTLKHALANLFRPGNQTKLITISIGIGMLLLTTIFIIESSFQSQLNFSKESKPNLFLIDIQPSQLGDLAQLLQKDFDQSLKPVPMVSARLLSLNKKPFERSSLEKDATKRDWAKRLKNREYLVSYRNEHYPSESIVSGKWWPETGRLKQEVSVDRDWAKELSIKLGDTLTISVQGRPLSATVTSMRRIDWSAMIPNSILVYSPDTIKQAPALYFGTLLAPNRAKRLKIQNTIVQKFPNITIFDAADTIKRIQSILSKISIIIRFLAALTIFTGLVILASSIFAGKDLRLKETMLLKVLGAVQETITKIMFFEYATLALIGLSLGLLLASAICYPLIDYFFKVDIAYPFMPVAATALLIIVLTTSIGYSLSYTVFKHKPALVLKEE